MGFRKLLVKNLGLMQYGLKAIWVKRRVLI